MQNDNGLSKKSIQFKWSKKHAVIGLVALLVALIFAFILPSHKGVDHGVNASAVNQAEDSGSSSNMDGYNINTGASTASLPVTAPGTSQSSAPNIAAAPTGVADQLNAITTQLQTIQTSLNSSTPANIKEIKSQLNSVVYEIKDMIAASDSNISQQIQSSSQSLQTEMDGMKGQLTNIQQLSQPGAYIDPSNLPFTVQFIDAVSGQNVVTVRYNNLLTPLSVGESLAGWTLVSADYASQYAVFQNSKDQLVKAGNNSATTGTGA